MTAFEAAVEYLILKLYSHPDGHNDKAGRWYPNKGEHAACCDNVRQPTRSFPWALWRHCHSLKHVATRTGYDPSEIREYFKKKNLPLFLTSDNAYVREWVAKQLSKEQTNDQTKPRKTEGAQSGIDPIQTPLGSECPEETVQ